MLTDLSRRIADWVEVNYRHLPLPPQFPSGGYWKYTLRGSLELYATYMRDLARFEFGELPDVAIPKFNKRGVEWEDLSPIHAAVGRAYLEVAETVTACAPALGRLLHVHNTVRKGSPEMDADIEALGSNLLLLDTRLRTRLRS
ncbi:hypothetical protein ACFZBU_39330 [Embleya sp. NPDC008237]|uniref:hypothetical protein n=1 Tax=Embleya sp. NPDC008237 TaxID=3363978 RepID=UPI0036EA9BD6